jgi:hypothetical protein
MPVALAGNHMPKRIKRLMSVFITQNGESVAALHSNNLQTVWKAQKHQHPRQFELIILSTFASSRSMAGLVPSSGPFMGRPTPSDESAAPDELVPGAAAVVPEAPPSWTYPSWTYEIPCHALPYRRGQTPRWLKRQRKGRCKEREAFSFQDSLVSPAGGRL